ncbi:unnamed protein product [Linum trigynum]|uniref:Reverse transcriptase zinc-binding domain-containing protein n=1 Tax=Linum trigynum TaxID=586398 RepID=A0AAV2G1G6_9ROSI
MHQRLMVSGTLEMAMVEKHDKYLGLPTVVGRSKKEIFAGLIERVRKKLKNWKEKTLSIGGRETLIKSVAQAQFTYAMSVFRVPSSIVKEVHGLITNFYWGQRGSERRIHWISHDELTWPKEEGGLGFRNLFGFNTALLARQVWSIHQRPQSLVARILQAKYYKKTTILEAAVGHHPSYIWRSLMSAQELLNEGIRWRIGNGASVQIWGDKWLPESTPAFVTSAPMGLPVDAKVRDLISPELDQWDETVVEACFPTEIASRIKQIPLRGLDEVDKQIWMDTPNGDYSAKSGYKWWLKRYKEERQLAEVGEAHVWKKLWAMEVPSKVKHFVWRFARDALPTGDHISIKSERRTDKCPFCDLKETQVHLFDECQWTSRLWRGCVLDGCFSRRGNRSCYEWYKLVMEEFEGEVLEKWSVLLWFLWKERNAHMFNRSKLDEGEIVARSQAYLEEYKQHQVREQVVATPSVKHWKKPDFGKVKINTDAGLLENGGIGLGVVIRDAEGNFILAAAKKIPRQWDVVTAEAMAAEMGVSLA